MNQYIFLKRVKSIFHLFIMKKAIVYVIALICCSCSSKPNNDDSGYDEYLIQYPSILTEYLFEVNSSHNFFFGNIADVKKLSDGVMVILDDITYSIHLMSEDGDVIKSRQIKGRGPGEVQNLFKKFRTNKEDYLAIYDYLMFKISMFHVIDGQITHVKDVALESGESLSNFFLNSYDQLIFHRSINVSSEDTLEQVMIININNVDIKKPVLELSVFEELILQGAIGGLSFAMSTSTKFHNRNELCSFDNSVYHIRTDSVGFSIYNLNDSKKNSSQYLNLPVEKLTYEDKEREINEILESSSGFWGEREKERLITEMPNYKPLVKKVICDLPDGIWLELMGNNDYPKWILFSDNGEIKGVMKNNIKGKIVSINSGNIFATETSDLGEIVLKVYSYTIENKL